MNRRIFLNIIIFGILTFYLLFSIVYRDVLDSQEADLTDSNPWEQPFLIPKGWQLQRLEFGDGVVFKNEQGHWTTNGVISDARASKIADNWTGLMVQDIDGFEDVVTGKMILAFVIDTTEPIVYRVIVKDNQILLYRLNDRRRFTLPKEIHDVILLSDA